MSSWRITGDGLIQSKFEKIYLKITWPLIWFRTVPEYIDRSDDVAWMLGCSLILLTIQVLGEGSYPKIDSGGFTRQIARSFWRHECFLSQTGIGLMESGMCSLKNEVQTNKKRSKSLAFEFFFAREGMQNKTRIILPNAPPQVHAMMKILASNCLGGLAFWAFGWGLSMGRSSYSTSFFGKQLPALQAEYTVQALVSSSTSRTGWTWRTLRGRSPLSTTSPFVPSTPPLSLAQWLRGGCWPFCSSLSTLLIFQGELQDLLGVLVLQCDHLRHTSVLAFQSRRLAQATWGHWLWLWGGCKSLSLFLFFLHLQMELFVLPLCVGLTSRHVHQVVHLVGGFSALVVTTYLGPRQILEQQYTGRKQNYISGLDSNTALKRWWWGTRPSVWLDSSSPGSVLLYKLYMGQIPQDGENGQNVAFFLKPFGDQAVWFLSTFCP